MKELTMLEIRDILSRHPKARQIPVENFLISMGTSLEIAMANLRQDTHAYAWTTSTTRAIVEGIEIACKGGDKL